MRKIDLIKFNKPTKQSGFTLIEIIVGIVVLSISYALLTSLIYPLASQSAAQIHQIRAAELGQSMVNEILGKAFDENSDMSGGEEIIMMLMITIQLISPMTKYSILKEIAFLMFMWVFL
jgi:prepilin-type N-terminal cleavage/methylation domain-containing protein